MADTLLIAQLANGFIVSGELIVLVFGAYFFYLFLQARDQLGRFTSAVAAIPSRFSIVLIFSFFFGSFLEGLAGFGIPAMLIAPVLLSLGFRPATSVVVPLAANTVSVTFGALGTPIKLGLGITDVEPIASQIVWFNALPILALPFLLALIYGQTEGEKVRWKHEWKMLFGAGIFFLVPYALTARISLEFPSVFGGLIGLVLFIRFCIPKECVPGKEIWFTTFYPYLLFIVLLVPAKFLLSKYEVEFGSGLRSVSLFQPGLIFVVTVMALAAGRASRGNLLPLASTTFLSIRNTMITILSLVCFSQIVQPGLTAVAASLLLHADAGIRPMLAPLIGVMGSFVTGSATMSVLLFERTFSEIAPSATWLTHAQALLTIGAAFGNAVSLQNIVMIKTAVPQPVSTTQTLFINTLFVLVLLVLVMLTGVYPTA